MTFEIHSRFNTPRAHDARALAPAERDMRTRPGEPLSRREVRRIIAEMIG